jgi:hypothetical protein
MGMGFRTKAKLLGLLVGAGSVRPGGCSLGVSIMSTKSGRRSWNIKVPRFGYAVAVSGVALGAVVSVAPAGATTMTYDVSFTDSGSYDTCQAGCPSYPYGSGTVSASFQITFDPTLLYLGANPLAPNISDLSVSATDSYLNPVSPYQITLDPILYWTYSYGTLTLSSDPSFSKDDPNSMLITLGINGFGQNPCTSPSQCSDSWYSQDSFGDTITASGVADITQTPLPAALPLFASGLGAFGLLGRRRKRKAASIVAA